LSMRESVEGGLTVKKDDPHELPERVLKILKIVPAARGLVRPVYSLGTQVSEDISLGGQESETVTNLAYARKLESNLSNWLNRVTGVGLRVDLVPSQSIEARALTLTG
jgi:hypothetical protein